MNLQLSNCCGSNVFSVSSQITHPASAATDSVKLVPLWLDFLQSCLRVYIVCAVINMVLHGLGATPGALARAVAKLQWMSLSSCHTAVRSSRLYGDARRSIFYSTFSHLTMHSYEFGLKDCNRFAALDIRHRSLVTRQFKSPVNVVCIN